MEISKELLRQIESDLGLNVPFSRGHDFLVKNCWHFYTDGGSVDEMFYGDDDFRDGMNRIYIVARRYSVVILAFVLMDTHVHFVLYGSFEDCNRFVHDYINATSRYIAIKHGDNNKLYKTQISHQIIDTDFYLKTVICYVIKNPPAGGLPFQAFGYPWSSGTLYFAPKNSWTSPMWTLTGMCVEGHEAFHGTKRLRQSLHTKEQLPERIPMIDGMVFPGEYVAYEIVERLFRSNKGYAYFMGMSRDSDVEAKGGSISHLSLPMAEMRQHKREMCLRMFKSKTVKNLNTKQRIKLAKALRAKYNSSPKQIARLCGLVYDDVKAMIQ